jgi:lyso-ornithine lipid O-acyltransferase
MTRRMFGRTRAVGSLILAMARVPIWLLCPQRTAIARHHERAFFARIVNGFGIRIERSGLPLKAPGTLYIMNHISWADIPVMMAMLDADFVAKSDILRWPVIGVLAQRFGPVFVARDRRGQSQDQASMIRARLSAGRSVILCPEGTTSNGSTILPFRTSLFAAADDAVAVQPVVLRYLGTNGEALSPEHMRKVAWIEDDELLPSAMQFARNRVQANLAFLPPVFAQSGGRKQMAQMVRERMLAAYAAAPNRPR